MRFGKVFPCALGICIVFLATVVMFQFQQYQDDIRESNRQIQIERINKIVEEKERDIKLLTSAIAGFYEGSNKVTAQEFETFSKSMISSYPRVSNIFIVDSQKEQQKQQRVLSVEPDNKKDGGSENNSDHTGSYTIVRSYPSSEFVGSKLDTLFPQYPAKIKGAPVALLKNPGVDAGSDGFVIVAVPFDFFIQPDLLFGNSYKLAFLRQQEKIDLLSERGDVVYAVEKLRGYDAPKHQSKLELTDQQKREAFHINKEISLFGVNLGSTYVLNYTVWSDSLSPSSQPGTVTFGPVYQWSLFGIGVSLAIITSVIMYRSESMKEHTQKISNELESNRKLLEADKEKEEFSTMITHELKTPLVTISGYAEILLDPQVGSLTEYQKEAVNEIIDSSKRLTKLIDDILTAQKLDIGRLSINKSEFDVAELVEGIKKDFEPTARDKGIALWAYCLSPGQHAQRTQKESKGESIILRSDKERILQVLANLVKNSMDFVKEGTGVIEVGARPYDSQTENIQSGESHDSVLFWVKDNGLGIPDRVQQKLFQKFYQVDSSATRSHGGTGLGLVISKGIVERLGGRIWFESKEGRGTVFYFFIPKSEGNE